MRTCPRCTLLNHDSAQVCDCGFSFTTISHDAVQAALRAGQRSARQAIVVGLFMTAAALAGSAFSFIVAKPGGWFFIAYGAVAVGAAMVGRGVSTLHRLADARKENEVTTPGA